jgi:hypothetical protein
MLNRSRALLWLIGALLGLWTLWATLILPNLEPAEGGRYYLRSFAVRLVLWIIPCGVYLWSQYGKGALRPLRLGLPPTAQHWGWSLVVTAIATLAISLNVARQLGAAPGEVWRLMLERYQVEFPATPLFEELVFRGVVFSGLLEVFTYAALGQHEEDPRKRALITWRAAWSANVLATVVFVGAHWPYWIYTDGLGTTVVMRSVPVFLLSLVLGMLFARGRSLWPCVLLHWINNELSALVPM